MVHRLNALRAARVSRDPSQSDTLNFWLHKSLESWLVEEGQRLLLIQGRYNSAHQMEHFGLEMTKFLSRLTPTVFVLSSFSNPGSRMAFGDIQPEQVLRQLSIQVLEKISVPQPLSFLAGILECFQTANSCNDWLKILSLIAEQVTELYVVLDLGVVHVQHAELLRNTLRNLLCETRSRVDWKVMLMSSRKLEPLVNATETIISPTANSRLPSKSNLPSVQRSLRVKLEGNDTATTKVANATNTDTAPKSTMTTTLETQ